MQILNKHFFLLTYQFHILLIIIRIIQIKITSQHFVHILIQQNTFQIIDFILLSFHFLLKMFSLQIYFYLFNQVFVYEIVISIVKFIIYKIKVIKTPFTGWFAFNIEFLNAIITFYRFKLS